MKFELPIKTISESNARGNWRPRYQRNSAQRAIAKVKTLEAIRAGLPPKPWLITMTRNGKKRLDQGNLAASMKAVQDGMADALKINDGDEAHFWRYEQTVGNEEYSVSVEIVTR